MNDFFTELDSDLLGVRGVPNSPIRLPEKEKAAELPPVVTNNAPVPREKRRESPRKPVAERPNTPPSNHIVEMRSQMMEAGVVTVVFKADEKTKTILGHLKLETRGFVYLDEVREVHKMIIKKARASYEDTLRDVPDIEEKDLLKIIRRDMETFITHKLNRSPVIIPIIVYV